MFFVQQISNFGSAAPPIAHLIIQSQHILQWVNRPKEETSLVVGHLWEATRNLLHCIEIADGIKAEVSEGRAQLSAHPIAINARQINLPGINNLQTRFESFLQTAKNAVASIGNTFEPYFG